MKINRSYRVEIDPNDHQKTLLEKSAGASRFVFNWGLRERINKYEKEKKFLTDLDQHKILCSIKKSEFPWLYEVSKHIPQGALRDLDNAFKNFFRGKKQGQKVGFPTFKSKHRGKNSFRISDLNSRKYIFDSYINILKIGKIKLKEENYIPTENIHYNSLTVSKIAGKWFVSVQCEINISEPLKPKTILGIDVGIKTLATCSNGAIFENNKYLKKSKNKLIHIQRELSRKIFNIETKKSSNNRIKTIKKIQRIHYKIACQRRDAIHKMTSTLVRTKPRFIVIENLNVIGMLKNHKLAESLIDASFYEIKRQLAYKTSWYGGSLIGADRFFPSSKTCRKCGDINERLTLEDRIFVCPKCGHTEDRDLNASINLEQYGVNTLSSRGIQACGENVSPIDACGLEAVSLKQEENSNVSYANVA